MERERIFYLLDHYADASWTAEERQELEIYLSDSPNARRWFWEHAQLSTLLREAYQQDAGREMVDVDARANEIVSTTACSCDEKRQISDVAASTRKHSFQFIDDLMSRGGTFNLPKLAAVIVAAMAIGSGLTLWLMGGSKKNPNNGAAIAHRGDAEIGLLNRSAIPAATLVNLTNCRWDPTRSTADMQGGAVLPGQSLNLLEGIAEISTSLPSGGVGRFQLEGPLLMMLNSQGMPSVQFGRLAAQVSCDLDRFTLDTPLGRAVVPHEASIGLVASTNEVELHVFAGEAAYEPLWSASFSDAAVDFNDDDDDIDVDDDLGHEALRVAPGTSLRISAAADDGSLSLRRGKADERHFVTHVSMTASRLDISDRYVAEIHTAKPIAYWRFESDAGGIVRNEMGERLACRVYGNGIRWRSYQGNRAAQFGATSDYGYLMSDEAIEGMIASDYSVEAWIKPSHFHYGAFFLLAGEPPTPSEPSPGAGLSFQLRGSSNRWRTHSPGRIRFSHRNPPASTGGTTCYSSVPYEFRRWQHAVGVKQGSTMRLYLDGRLVANGKNSTELADGLRVLMGQLHPHDPTRNVIVRPFVGEMDEVALYSRALSEREILRHYQLARPATEPLTNHTAPGS